MARHGRLAAFSLYDFADSAFATVIVTVLYNQYYAGTVAGGPEGVVLLGLRIPGATMFTWLQAFSMALVAVAAPFLGALADRRRSRTGFLALFWFPGVLLTVALAGVEAGEWIEGGLLFATAYICFAASSIFYNALLPEIGPPADLGRLSGIAWGIGYFGGGIVLILDLVLLKKPSLLGLPEGDLGIGACFALAGLWWFVFALPLLWVFRGEFFRSARSPIVAAGSTADGTAPLAKLERSAGGPSHPTGVVAQVRHTLSRVARLPELRRFFIAYLLYNDAVQTVVGVVSIFAAQELGFPVEQLILIFLLIQGTAFAGSFLLGWMADRFGHKQTLLLCVFAWTFFTIWAAAAGIFGNAVREFWILGGICGLFLGGIQSCSRSMLTGWIPEGRESEIFGFFSVVSRAAAVFGPLIYGGLVLVTGSLRGGVLAVALMFLAGGLTLARLRPERITAERARLGADV